MVEYDQFYHYASLLVHLLLICDVLLMVIFYSTIAWTISWTEEPGGLYSSQGHTIDTTEVTQHTHSTINLYHSFNLKNIKSLPFLGFSSVVITNILCILHILFPPTVMSASSGKERVCLFTAERQHLELSGTKQALNY